MCDTDDRAEVIAAESLPASLEWTGEVLPLEPVDELSVLTVCDNTVDILLPDEGPAKRLPLAAMARQAPPLEAPTILGGKAADVPLAQHGFSALVEVRKGGRVRRLLFDTGMTPDGCAGNLRRLGQDPAGIEAIVCSHGHFDHTTGLSGLIGQLGRVNLPVLIHPGFWARRRLAIPGGEPFELPTTSRRALEDAGFDVIEQRQPSFLYDRSVLITGEVDRVTGFEKGFAIHQAWRGQSWEPDPLILDDQALIAHVAGPRAGRAHRLRARGRHQHLPLRPAPDRRRQAARRHRRVPPGRPAVRTGHRGHRQRSGAARPRGHRPRSLHRLEGHPRDRPPPARRIHPEQRRHHLPSHRRDRRVKITYSRPQQAGPAAANRRPHTPDRL